MRFGMYSLVSGSLWLQTSNSGGVSAGAFGQYEILCWSFSPGQLIDIWMLLDFCDCHALKKNG